MRYLLTTLLIVSKAMATRSQRSPDVDTPRIVHALMSPEIFAFPSPGGFVRKMVSRVELDWLNLTARPEDNMSNETAPIASTKLLASHNSNEEDAFTLRLMQIGGRWWPDSKLYDRHSHSAQFPYGHHYPPNLDVGYTASGSVLVLRTWASNSQYVGDLPDVPPEKPDDWSRLLLCSTMEERCQVLRSFGAVEHGSVDVCLDLPGSLGEGIAIGRHYEGLLRNMEDKKYLDRWMDSLWNGVPMRTEL